MIELEIILPIHPSVPSIWELVGWCLAAGVTPLIIFMGLWFWKSEPMTEQEKQNVLRRR